MNNKLNREPYPKAREMLEELLVKEMRLGQLELIKSYGAGKRSFKEISGPGFPKGVIQQHYPKTPVSFLDNAATIKRSGEISKYDGLRVGDFGQFWDSWRMGWYSHLAKHNYQVDLGGDKARLKRIALQAIQDRATSVALHEEEKQKISEQLKEQAIQDRATSVALYEEEKRKIYERLKESYEIFQSQEAKSAALHEEEKRKIYEQVKESYEIFQLQEEQIKEFTSTIEENFLRIKELNLTIEENAKMLGILEKALTEIVCGNTKFFLTKTEEGRQMVASKKIPEEWLKLVWGLSPNKYKTCEQADIDQNRSYTFIEKQLTKIQKMRSDAVKTLVDPNNNNNIISNMDNNNAVISGNLVTKTNYVSFSKAIAKTISEKCVSEKTGRPNFSSVVTVGDNNTATGTVECIVNSRVVVIFLDALWTFFQNI